MLNKAMASSETLEFLFHHYITRTIIRPLPKFIEIKIEKEENNPDWVDQQRKTW